MNIETAKAKLCGAYVALNSDNGFMFSRSAIAKIRAELSELSQMLDCDDPAQAELLHHVIDLADELRHAERHSQNALQKLQDAVVTMAIRHDELKI